MHFFAELLCVCCPVVTTVSGLKHIGCLFSCPLISIVPIQTSGCLTCAPSRVLQLGSGRNSRCLFPLALHSAHILTILPRCPPRRHRPVLKSSYCLERRAHTLFARAFPAYVCSTPAGNLRGVESWEVRCGNKNRCTQAGNRTQKFSYESAVEACFGDLEDNPR